MIKKIVILGSTGNVGKKVLEVVSRYRRKFKVVGLGARSNFRLLLKQAEEFNVKKLYLKNFSLAKRNNYTRKEIFTGKEGLIDILNQDVDLLILSISGTDAVYPLLSAIEKGIDIALANKEAIVSSGEIVSRKLKRSRSRVIPLDSEHNAIFQMLSGIRKDDIANIILTCSGGPFFNYSRKDLDKVTPEMALTHPRWKMGKKITVDSATLMNKGFEIIEAHYIFQLPPEKIKVLIHPEATIHGLIELKDGTVLAELAPTDMKMSIAYALGYPERLNSGLRINWNKVRSLTFKVPEGKKYLALEIASRCLNSGKSFPAFLVKLDEIFVSKFLSNQIKFTQILPYIQESLKLHRGFEIKNVFSLEKVFEEAERISSNVLKRRF